MIPSERSVLSKPMSTADLFFSITIASFTILSIAISQSAVWDASRYFITRSTSFLNAPSKSTYEPYAFAPETMTEPSSFSGNVNTGTFDFGDS